MVVPEVMDGGWMTGQDHGGQRERRTSRLDMDRERGTGGGKRVEAKRISSRTNFLPVGQQDSQQ